MKIKTKYLRKKCKDLSQQNTIKEGIKFTGSIWNNFKHILLSARWKVQDGKEGQGEAGGWAATFGRGLTP